jgi:hypothetical protein
MLEMKPGAGTIFMRLNNQTCMHHGSDLQPHYNYLESRKTTCIRIEYFFRIRFSSIHMSILYTLVNLKLKTQQNHLLLLHTWTFC